MLRLNAAHTCVLLCLFQTHRVAVYQTWGIELDTVPLSDMIEAVQHYDEREGPRVV